MSKIIEKMEFLENDYVKSINSDNNLPLNQFNHELNAIINQNKLFRNHNLNQLSGGGTYNYIVFRIYSFFHLCLDFLGDEFKDIEKIIMYTLYFVSKI